MIIKPLHRLLMGLLLLVFTGQTLAMAAMPCQWKAAIADAISPHHYATKSEPHCDHHVMSQGQPVPVKPALDCCKTHGHCLAGSAPAIIDQTFSALLQHNSVMPLYFYGGLLVSSPVFPPFRPPILG